MLEVSQLAVTDGQHRALKGVPLGVKPGEIVVSLGAGATAALGAFDHLIRTSAPEESAAAVPAAPVVAAATA